LMEMLLVATTQMKMRGDTTLKDLLSVEDYEKVRAYFESKETMLPFSMLETMKPFFAASTLQQKDMPCESMSAMEQVIMLEAKQYKKEINGLETMSYQAGILDSIPYKLQAQQLVEYINNEGKGSETINETEAMLKAYMDQDLIKLEAMINKSDIGISNFTEILLNNRNRNWVKKLKELMPGKTLLIAVGAGHLPGNQGVIELLKKEGYTVEPIENKMIKVKEI
ncbi:MAG TPA: TraB/GumN family protein, partial [Chitinophagaceae bacterium]